MQNLKDIATGRYYDTVEIPKLLKAPYLSNDRLDHALLSSFERTRRLATDIVVGFRVEWTVHRLLLIALRKPQQSTCYLSRLPSELIRSIMNWYIFLGGWQDSTSNQGISNFVDVFIE
jgi:hypothetical protein